MRFVILLCFLVIVLYVQAEADPSEGDAGLSQRVVDLTEEKAGSEVERSARAVPRRRARPRARQPRARHARRPRARQARRPRARQARRPRVRPAKRRRARRFRTRPSRHGRQYYKRMMGLRASKAYWQRRVKGNLYNAIKTVFDGEKLPENFSWTNKSNIVTSVKHQGSCGSCYSFTAVGAIESMLAIWDNKPNLDLSEQQIVDCSQAFGNMGCDGGLMEDVYRWISKNGGVKDERAYPYVANVRQCRNPPGPKFARAITFAQIPYGVEDGLRSVVYHMGPVGIGIHGSLSTFFDYAGGIYDDEDCKSDSVEVDHGVLLVGWGVENGDPYWLIRNSWGSEWGENGYVKLSRGEGMCKIGQMASVPVLQRVARQLLARKPVRHNMK